MLEGKYRVISVDGTMGDLLEVGEVLNFNNGICIFKSGYKTIKYETIEEFEKVSKIKVQNITEVITIKGRDFSVLKGLRSINKWGYKTEILQAKYAIVIVIDEDMKNHITLRTDKSDECIKEMIMLQGFEIDFEDTKDVDNFEELKELVKNKPELRIIINETMYLEVWYSEFEQWVDLPVEEIEKKYNIKLNILKED